MKKRGFTLIELLAVIVVLAIISLIAVPIVLNIIEDIKRNTEIQSINFYGKAVRQAITREQLTNSTIIEGSFEVYGKTEEEKDGRTITNGITTIIVDYEGNVVCSVINITKNGSVNLSGCKVDGKDVEYVYGDSITSSDKNKTYANGDIVYFDVKAGKGCTNYHEDNSKTGYNGINGTGNQTSCLKFYAFLDDGSDKINLILDHNTTGKVAWSSSNNNNNNGPKEVINSLYNDTKDWNGTITPLDYIYNHSTRSYTIEYSKVPVYEGATTAYKARLITANEIAKITGAHKEDTLNWKEESSTSWYYLDGAKGTTANWQTKIADSANQSEYYWLYDRTYNCTTYGCKVLDNLNYGYWTSSAHVSNSNTAWTVHYRGRANNNYADSSGSYGVRPVITISKSNIGKR